MDIKTMTSEELVERRSALALETENADADLDAIEAEVNAINAELELRKAEAEKRGKILDAVANGAGVVTEKIETMEERKEMPEIEIRNTDKYIDAFAKYIKTGNGEECRSLLTENVQNGTIAVPSFVDDMIRTAWESDEILSRVKKTYFKGNHKVMFERSADDALVHTEGTSAISEENLVLGIVEMKPETIKKLVSFSTEAETMGGRRFVEYIYDEIIKRITLLAAKKGVLDIAGASTSHSGSAVGVPKVTAAPSVTLVKTAAANLSDEARNPVIIMNRLSEVNFLAAQASGNFAIDPFAGLPVLYTSALPAYDSASANAVYAIVGDLDGLQFNYPEGDGVSLIYDNVTKKAQDIVEVLGRQYAAHGVTAPGRFCNVAKPSV